MTRDNLRFIKGNDGTTVFEDSVVLTGTAHMLVANVVTSANRPVGATGAIVLQSDVGSQFYFFERGTWTPRRDIGSMDIPSQGTGDMLYAAGATGFARLAAGGSGSVLQANGAAAPGWVPNAGALALLGTGQGSVTGSPTDVGTITVTPAGPLNNLLIILTVHASGGTGAAPILKHGSAGLMSTSEVGFQIVLGNVVHHWITIERQRLNASSIFVRSLTTTGQGLGGSGFATAFWKMNDGSLGTGYNDEWLIVARIGPNNTGTMHWAWRIYEMKAI